MSITTIKSTMQAQIMQDVQRMQANAQAPVLPAMTFSSTNPDVSFNRIMYGVQVRNKIATGFNDLMSMSI